MTHRLRSIRARLLVSLLGAATLIWAMTAVVAYRDALHEVDELLDAHLAQAATLLIAQGGEVDEIDTEHAPLLHRYSRRVAFQIWEDGTLRLHSVNAPNQRLSPRESGFSEQRIGDTHWRVFSVRAGELLIQVAEDSRARGEIARSTGRSLILPIVIGLPLLGLLIAWSVRRNLQPLLRLSDAVSLRAPDYLEPLPMAGDTPAELRPLVKRLNTLLSQLADSFESERRFSADAAHELRTPIAALRVQAQVAQRAASDQERSQALDKVLQGCDRAARLVDQLLTLARLGPAHLRSQLQPVELHGLCASVLSDLAEMALSHDVELVLDEGGARVMGHADLLAILLRNLIDNAIRYSEANTRVRVRVIQTPDAAAVEVIDQGPGIAPEVRGQLGQRFRRLGRADVHGSGLGLSIAQRIAGLHGARLVFADGERGRGLKVRVLFNPEMPPGQSALR